MSARQVQRNAAAILRAASYRRTGCRMWDFRNGLRAAINAPSRSALGWFAFSWYQPDGRRTVDLARHRGIAKAEARRIIAALH